MSERCYVAVMVPYERPRSGSIDGVPLTGNEVALRIEECSLGQGHAGAHRTTIQLSAGARFNPHGGLPVPCQVEWFA